MIDDEVAKTVEEVAKLRSADEGLKRLRDFYDEMKRLGIAQTREYDLPPIDTIGTTAYRRDSQA
ncbi:MAG: hypothetical protein LC667_07195 [Thioalkalivibrio sp.]|nr:hypothetical protein [Thioalkalivibrio sp.]